MAALLTVSFAGCGEQVVDLTEDEEEQIVAYASGIISKYNKKQPDGLMFVLIPEEDETSTEETAGAEPDTEASTELPEGYYDPEDFEDLPTTTGTDVDAITIGEAEDTGAVPMELSEVIGIDGFDMQWTGTEVADDYMDPSGAVLATPNAGNRYVILTITVTNQTEADQLCNVAELVPDFELYPGSGDGIRSSQMLVSTDFSSMNETVPAGESVERKLFFQRKESDISEEDTYRFEVTLNGVTGLISEK